MMDERMSEFEEYEPPFEEQEEPPFTGPPEDRSFGIVLLAIVVVVLGGVGGYFLYRTRQQPAPAPKAASTPATPTPVPAPEAAGLPSLDQSDDFVRELLKGLSSHAQVGLWASQQGLVRLFVNVVETVSKGDSPRATLGFLAPKGPFATTQRKGRLLIDPKSYERYDAFAEGVASLDGAALAEVFRRTLPLLEAAYRELGYPEGGFEKTLREGIAHLLKTPVIEGEIPVKPIRRGNLVVYELVDPALEGLSPAQKHLLRMGPANVKRIQGTLRGLLSAIGS